MQEQGTQVTETHGFIAKCMPSILEAAEESNMAPKSPRAHFLIPYVIDKAVRNKWPVI